MQNDGVVGLQLELKIYFIVYLIVNLMRFVIILIKLLCMYVCCEILERENMRFQADNTKFLPERLVLSFALILRSSPLFYPF